MFKNIPICVISFVLVITSILFVVNNRTEKMIYAENENVMSIEYIVPSMERILCEDDPKFFFEIVDLTDHEGQSYFVNYRIKREQMRQETKEMLGLLLESDITQTREQAQKRWLNLADKIAQEGEIENIIKMQGYKDVVSDVNGDEINITILSESLNQQEINRIKRVAVSVTAVIPEKIQVRAKF